MIRRATFGDRQTIYEIWRTCFDDNESYINFFIDRGFDADSCLVWEELGSPVAMLHLLNAKFFNGVESYPVQYVYAAATMPAFRGSGIMASLLNVAVKEGGTQGCLFTFLLPSNNGLYDYYSRLGFKASFNIQKAKLTHNELINACAINFGTSNTFGEDLKNQLGNANLHEIRQAFFSPSVLWDKPEFSYAITEWQFSGGEILRFRSGYALCIKHKDGVEVREFCGEFPDVAAALLSHFGDDNFTFFLPPYIDAPFKTEQVLYGMLIPSNKSSNVFETVKKVNPYLNLLLE